MIRVVVPAAFAAFASTLVFTGVAFGQAGYGGPSSAASQPTTQQAIPSHPAAQSSRSSSSASAAGAIKLREEVRKPMAEAVKLFEAKDYQGALAKAREADAIADKTPGENYVIAKFIGQISINLNDRPTATAMFNRAIATGAMPDAEKPNMLYIAMALNAEAKNHAQAIAYGEQLVALGPLDEKSAVVLAQAYYNKGDYPSAVRVAKAALAGNVVEARNKAALLEVQTKGQAQQGDQGAAVASLEAQCAESCDGKSWGQLVGVTMSKIGSRMTDHMALNLFRLRLMAGGMDANDYLTMATLARSLALPAEAQSVLQKGIASGTVTRSGRVAETLNAASTEASRESRTLATFEREAAASSRGEVDVKLGETYYAHGQLGQAETAMRRGMGKGGVRDMADAHITLGVILLAAGKKAEAIAEFKAAEASAAQAPVARMWAMFAGRKG
jgi:tetratricopeptide (TPR) repeat protein